MLQINERQEEKMVELLAIIYCKINWSKIRTRVNPHDIFNHRVRSAARRPTLYAFVSCLCNKFGLQSLKQESQIIIDYLRPVEQQVLNLLNTEHIPYCTRAVILAKNMKKEANKNDKKD